jgi:hypothetical protein
MTSEISMATLHLKVVDPNPVNLSSTVPRATWLKRFAECLLLLEARTIAMSAARHVAASHPEACEQEPEEVAAKFVFEGLPAEATHVKSTPDMSTLARPTPASATPAMSTSHN